MDIVFAVRIFLIIFILFLGHSNNDTIKMPNIGYILRGYDILLGNPMSTTASTDPGFCLQPIFSAKYNSGKVTADQRYNIPDGTEVLSCVGKCSMTFGSSLVAGASSYTSSLDIKVTKLLFLFIFL